MVSFTMQKKFITNPSEIRNNTAVMMQMHQSIKLLFGLVPCASLKSKEKCSKIQNGDTRQYMWRMQSFELGFWINDGLVHSTHASSKQIHNHNMVCNNERTEFAPSSRRGSPFHGCNKTCIQNAHTSALAHPTSNLYANASDNWGDFVRILEVVVNENDKLSQQLSAYKSYVSYI